MSEQRDPLSARLTELAAWLREYELDGVEMAPAAVQGFVTILELAATDAAELERSRMPSPHAEGGAMNGNVVPLHRVPPA